MEEDLAAWEVAERTWDAGREGTFHRVACRDSREEERCIAVGEGIQREVLLRILAAEEEDTADADLPDQRVGTWVGNSLAGVEDVAVEDAAEDAAAVAAVELPDAAEVTLAVLLAARVRAVVQVLVVDSAAPSLKSSFALPSPLLGELVSETSRYWPCSWCWCVSRI